MKWSGKHVWVCGASSGIGNDVARLLARRGATVSATARRLDLLEELVADMNRSSRANHGCHRCDVRVNGDIKSVYGDMVAARGPVDVLVYVSGINQNNLPTVRLLDADIDAVLETNLVGAIHTVHAVLPAMIARGGTICGVSSLAGYRGLPGASVYGASKAGFSNFLESLRIEMRIANAPVTVCDVCPGFVDTTALDVDALHLPRLLVLSGVEAAEAVLSAVAHGTAHYGFPFVMEHCAMALARLLPCALYDRIIAMGSTTTHDGVRGSLRS